MKKEIQDKKGYIALWRKLAETDLWFAEPFTRGQAWVDLLLLASHKDTYYYLRGNKIDVKRGEIRRSEQSLSKRWGWSRNKLRRFLKHLETEQQIEQQKCNIINKITIVNYDYWQKTEQQTEQQKDDRKTTESTHTIMLNNDNNVNKPPIVPQGVEKELWDDFLAMRKKMKAVNSERALKVIAGKLKKFSAMGYAPNDLISSAIEHSWKTVYKPKEKSYGTNKPTRTALVKEAAEEWLAEEYARLEAGSNETLAIKKPD